MRKKKRRATKQKNFPDSAETVKKDVIQWHSAFCSAMQLEFMEDKGRLEYYPEKILNTAPLRIDLLILLFDGEEKLKNVIGEIFQRYNIVEYKSPGDSMTIDDFYKVIAYAALYKGKSGTVNGYRAKDLTITLVREGFPREMFKQLEEDGFQTVPKRKGIYEIKNSIFRTQVVVTQELNEDEHIWLRSLTRRMTLNQLEKLAIKYQELPDGNEKQWVESVVDVVSQANFEMIREWKEGALMNAAVAELFRPDIENLKMLLERERQEKERLLAKERQEKERLLAKERQEKEKLLAQERQEKEKLLEEVKYLRAELEKNNVKREKG